MEQILTILNQIGAIKDIEELTILYSFEDLQHLYKELQKIDLNLNIEFEKIMLSPINVEQIRTLWEHKNNITQYNLLLLKALTAIERNKNLEQAEMITKKLQDILKEVK